MIKYPKSNILTIQPEKILEAQMSRVFKSIEETPALQPSKDSGTKRSSKFVSPSRQGSKTTRSIVIEKRKIINKLVPNDLNASRTKFKSKETLLKRYLTDIAVNTASTGPLQCDNECVTMVRKRDNKFGCKCGQKRLACNGIAKEIQTLDCKNYFLTDRACAQCIETANCGTQFYEKLSDGVLIPQFSTKKSSKDTMKNNNSSLRDPYRIREESVTSKPGFLNCMGAKRWALSQYPTRGPDF